MSLTSISLNAPWQRVRGGPEERKKEEDDPTTWEGGRGETGTVVAGMLVEDVEELGCCGSVFLF